MLSLRSPNEIALNLAKRLRSRRLRRGWTQAELAERAGMRLPTYILFERTGRISLLRLLKLLDVLDLSAEFDGLFRGEDLTGLSLDDLVRPERKRGLRSRS